MKAEAHDYLHSRITNLKRELRLIEQERQRVEAYPSLDTERQAMYISYYDAIIRHLLNSIDRLEVTLKCAAGSA